MIKKGSLIKWYELYGDIQIVKDCGSGIVLDICIQYYNKLKLKHYRVLTNTGIIKNFEEHCVDSLN